MDARLASGDSEVVSDPAFYSSYEEKKQNLDNLMQRWEKAHNELEEFMSEYMNTDDQSLKESTRSMSLTLTSPAG